MQSATEGVQDGENILGKFLLGAVIRVAENHDLAAVLLGHPPDEVEPEPGEPVPVGNHNTELIAAMESLQQGDKSFALEVEPATNIGDEPGVGIALPHEDNLPLQVVALLGGTDPAVADGFGRSSPGERRHPRAEAGPRRELCNHPEWQRQGGPIAWMSQRWVLFLGTAVIGAATAESLLSFTPMWFYIKFLRRLPQKNLAKDRAAADCDADAESREETI